MKHQIKSAIALLLCVLSIFCLVACADKGDPWNDARYTSDQTLGEGAKTLTVLLTVEEHVLTFTVHTDADTLGEALMSCGLIEGEQGPYGLYVKKANGITADYDVNQRYWSFSKNGKDLLTGVDMEPVEDGAHYEITFAK